ncbi:hypothetical protein KIW84_015526 [Lathyrus oleraceus]|uniref:Uncharacterized protein n=1 Tax=Pisum sativum TaxID=3888 RepID=A0A9D5H126_PEA|nr:hypothetical protein KIW84_015526 [Pisum sativum]
MCDDEIGVAPSVLTLSYILHVGKDMDDIVIHIYAFVDEIDLYMCPLWDGFFCYLVPILRKLGGDDDMMRLKKGFCIGYGTLTMVLHYGIDYKFFVMIQAWKCTKDNVLFLKRQENDRVFMFLAGLNKDLDEVRGRVLGKVPLPTLRETFAEIRREEVQQGVMMGKTPQSSEYEGSTLATKNLDEGRRSKKVPWCDNCKRKWHTCETYWKLKGKPPK